MDAKQFAEGYKYTMRPEEIHVGTYSMLIEDAQERSYDFGLLLHEKLRDEQSEGRTPEWRDEYQEWASKTLPGLGFTFLDAALDDALHARNEVNFHLLNKHMLDMWLPLINGGWSSSAERLRCLNASQDSLALEGLGHYALRQKVVDMHGGHALYEDADSRSATNTQVGAIQEIDAAIVLLDVVRRNPNLTVVPAPLQFERTSKRRNVDFVAVDFVDRKAVGVQVVTRLTDAEYKQADKERVVFIDGTVDLGNVRAMRTYKGKSAERVVPWPGIIAAKRVDAIKTHGKYAVHLTDRTIKTQGRTVRIASRANEIVRHKLFARSLVGNIKIDYQDLSQKIGERILRSI